MPGILHIRVTPNAAANRVMPELLADGTQRLRVYVTTVPEDGKANKAAIALVADYLGVPKSSLEITHGHNRRDKRMQIL